MIPMMFRKMTLISSRVYPDPCEGTIHHQTFTVHSDGRVYWSISLYTGEEQETVLAESVFRKIRKSSAENILSAVEECVSRPKRVHRINGMGWYLVAESPDGKFYRERGTDPFKNVGYKDGLSEYIRLAMDTYCHEGIIGIGSRNMWLFDPVPGSKTKGIDTFGGKQI